MEIKEFFENYKHYYNILVSIYRKDNRLESERDIYTYKEFNNFIKDYGDSEFKDWTVEYRDECTQFHFFLN